MRRVNPGLWTCLLPVALLFALLAPTALAQQAEPEDALAAMRFDIVGPELAIDPPALTVPKNIPTEIHAKLRAAGSDDPALAEALAELAVGAEVVAELRGPSLPAVEIRVRAGDPIPIPPLALPGDYFIDQIRLEKDGEVLLDGTPSSVPIKVISEVMVTSVSSRPLSLEEIREKGIVIDEHSFQAFEFELALDFDSEELRIKLPVVLPKPESEGLSLTAAERVDLAALNQSLAQGALTTLPDAFDRPGLNFALAAVPFVPAAADNVVPGFELPPITGLVVIPSNIAFLNQFFSVLLMVGNVAPDGTPLVLANVEGEITLPLGPDHVAGSLEVPGDDPLRLARIEGIGVQPIVPVTLPGADGELGTADDLPQIAPGEQGSGEFLVEGLREGAHTVEIEINATLEGLPSGPVELTGMALGSVFVRNPTFSITLSHPRTVRSGEHYDLYATITNTSETVANLASMNLSPRSISGAVLVSEPSVQFESIDPGESVSARFELIAQETGEVRFSAFNTESGVSGHFELRTGIGERGIALAPNAIVLPEAASELPDALVAAAQRVLGQAFSIATAPAGGLPADVLFVKRQTVFERGRDLGAAGQRLVFGEPLERVVWDLLLDWMGRDKSDEGFDQLLRQTDAGAQFMSEIAAILQGQLAGMSLLDLQRDFAETTVARAPHVSAIVGAGSSGAPVRMRIIGRSGGAVGADAEGDLRSLADAALLALADGAGRADMILLSQLGDAPYRLEVVAEEATSFDLGLTLPGASDELLHLRYPLVPLQAGGVARVILALDGSAVLLEVDQQGDGSIDSSVAPIEESIVEGPPQVITLRQLEATSGRALHPANHGLLIAVLFDKPVDSNSATALGSYDVEQNSVIGTALQPRERLVFLYLEKPVGALVPRQMTLSGVKDADGRLMVETTLPIEMRLSDGARVMGQVRTAQGDPVAGAVLDLTIKAFEGDKLVGLVVSRVLTLGDGSFEFDFVSRFTASFVLTAQHPVSGLLTRQSARVSAAGQTLLLNPTFRGAGTVRGHVYGDDGVTPAPGAEVSLIPEVPTAQLFYSRANELGEYVFGEVPVGLYRVQARGRYGWGQASGVLPSAGEEAVTDIDLLVAPDRMGQLEGRVFAGDGVTPAAGVSVYVGTFNREGLQISAVAQGETDGNGYFSFDRIPPPEDGETRWEVVAVDLATTQIGVTSYTFVVAARTSTNVRLEGAGVVEGLVLNAQGQRVEGAVVAGGLELLTTDADGFFRMENVPGGTRSLEAGNPLTKRQGATQVTVIPGQTVNATITLSGRASIVGQVLDEYGDPVPGVSVRIPTTKNDVEGFLYVIADSEGSFEFPYLELQSYLLQAPGPDPSELIDQARKAGVDPRLAYTRGDWPEGLDDEPMPASSNNPLLAASLRPANPFVLSASPAANDGLASGPPEGPFGWARADLLQDGDVQVADIRYLSQGSVSGATTTAAGVGIGAMVRVMGLSVANDGSPTTTEFGRLETDAATGAFSFDGIPVFDLQGFLNSGVRTGNFSLEALNPFYPVTLIHSGQLNTNEPHVSDIQLAFPDAQETNGTITGTVYLPDGVTPAPEHTVVRISFGDLAVQTDADGRFETIFEIPAGGYRLEVEEPAGLRAEASVQVPAGANIDVEIRLLGLGSVTVDVVREDGSPVVGGVVSLLRGSFPNDEADGAADGAGRVRFVNISEGEFSVSVVEPITGLSGRASGVVVRDGEVAVTAVITSSGTVEGIFLQTDGVTPIANAQVELEAGAIAAYATTDGAGRFSIDAVPTRVSVSVSALDPLTGRSGSAEGEIPSQDAVIELTLIQGPRGTVEGMVLQADGATRVPGSTVMLDINGRYRVYVSARADGSFRFEGIPQSNFTVHARDLQSGFWGSAHGWLRFEGEVARADVLIDGWGSIEGTVLDASGEPAGNSVVEIAGPGVFRTNIGADADGRFRVEFLPVNKSYRVSAHSIADEDDKGVVHRVELDRPDDVVDVTVQLEGVRDVEVLVVSSDGVTPVSGVSVLLTPRTGDSSFAFTNSSGLAVIPGIAPGRFEVQAEIGPLGGVAAGEITGPGAPVFVTVELGPAAAIEGSVLLSDGMTVAVDALVTLDFQTQGGGSATLQLRTNVLGEFFFIGIPLGPFSLRVFEPVSRGVASYTGSLGVEGETLDVGSLVVDSESPLVLSVTPGDGAAAAPVDGTIVIEFSEAMQPESFLFDGLLQNVSLLAAGISVPFDDSLSADGTMLTLAPLTPLASDVLHTLSVRGAPDGPMDGADLTLVLPFVSSFTTEDSVPPALVSTSPANLAVEVLPEAVVRITFSEPVDSALAIELETSAGSLVAGQLDTSFGGSVAIFTPSDYLNANESYTVRLSGVQDRAGNPLTGGDTSFSFATVDTLAPVLAALELQGAPLLIGGGDANLLPTLPDADTVRVEYEVTGVGAEVATTAPFGLYLTLPVAGGELAVVAVAVDDVGNRSEPLHRNILVAANQPPTVSLESLSGNGPVGTGQTLRFAVDAADDLALQQVVFSTTGPITSSTTEPVPGSEANYQTEFQVLIPEDASANSVLSVQVTAVDSVGQTSAPKLLTYVIEDAVPPTLSIVSPPNGAQVIAGSSIEVVMSAADEVELASVELACTPALSGCELRALPSDTTTTRQSFELAISADLSAPSQIALLATALDVAGNERTLAHTLAIADDDAPVMLDWALAGDSGALAPGQTIRVRAEASDNVAVIAFSFSASGALETTADVTIEPATSSAEAIFEFTIPAEATTGETLTVTARALDAAGNASALQSLNLTIQDEEVDETAPVVSVLAPQADSELSLGSSFDISLNASDDTALARVELTLSGALAGIADGGSSNVTRVIDPPAASVAISIALSLAVDGATGSGEFGLQAFDTAGNASELVTRSVQVVDVSEPSIFADANLQACFDALGVTYTYEVTNLNCPNRSISSLVGIEALTSLRVLNLNNNVVSDLSPLAGLVNLESLDLSRNNPSSLAPLESLTGLTYLNLFSSGISDVALLAGLVNLESLYLGANVITNIVPLAGMTNLTLLNIYSNAISDLTPLAGLVNLSSLTLYNNDIANIAPLAGLTKLTLLHLYTNDISDLTPLAGLATLQYLYLANNPITSIAPLAGLTSLQYLFLDNTDVTDLSSLSSLVDLVLLGLRSLGLTDISTLADLSALQTLYLDGNTELVDLSPISGLTGLTTLYISSTGVTSTAQLEGLSNLRRLNMNSLGISDLSGLSALTGLQYLYLSSNAITDLSPLAGLTSLTYLYLDNNDITDVSALASLASLSRLHLHQNHIVDISALATLSSLRYLYAYNNAIEDVSPLAALTGMNQVYLYGNAITTGVASLVTLISASVIDLRYQYDIPCVDLDILEAALGTGVVYAPDACFLDTDSDTVPDDLDAFPFDPTEWGDADGDGLGDNADTDDDGDGIPDVDGDGDGLGDNVDNCPATSNPYQDDVNANGVGDVCEAAPNANDDTLTAYRDAATSLFVLSNDSDAENDPLTIVEITQPSNGSAVISGGSLVVYTSNAGYTGADSFSYSIHDGRSDVLATATVTIDVVPPVAIGSFSDANLQACVDALGLNYTHEVINLYCASRSISSLAGIEALTSLRSLYLYNNAVSDLGPLSGLVGLESLAMARNSISDLSPLATLTGLKSLDVSYADISDLAPLAGLVGLETLTLGFNSITSIAPLAGLANLTQLNLYANTIANIAPLAGLTSLTSLNLYRNAISDLTPLAGLVNLSSLSLFDNDIANIAPLAGLTKLTLLHLYTNAISDLTPLTGLANLQNLYIANNPITSIAPLAGLTSLQYLYLDNTDVTDLSPLSSLVNLVVLGLRNLGLTDISALAGLSALQNLFIDGNTELVDLSPISGLTGLTALYLNSTGVTSTAQLAGMTNLRTLSMSQLGLRDLSGLSALTDLQSLVLSGNVITDLSPLASLTSLTYLYLDNNDITDVSALASLTSLNQLFLHQNNISDISPLAGLSSLQYLYAYNNAIEDVSSLAGLTSLYVLYLHSNSITTGVASLVTLTGTALIDLRFQYDIPCVDLDTLEAALGTAVVYSPDACFLDTDSDSVRDELDAFPLDPTEWSDVDGDGLGDNADTDDDDDGIPDVDGDGDGLGDNVDNCPATSNPYQDDINANGVGDVCEAAPIANDDTLTAYRDAATSLYVLSNDSDAENDPLTIVEITQPSNGYAVISGGSLVVYTGNAGYTGADSFSYSIHDGRSDVLATATVTIDVVPPVALGSFGDANLQACIDALGLSYTHEVTDLYCGNRSISSLVGIEALTSLRTLDLYNNVVSDLGPLSGLVGLETLAMAQNDISDLSPLAALTGLKSLDVSYGDISDLTPLAGLGRLETLSLGFNSITSIAPLAALTNLVTLNVHGNDIGDLTPLAGLDDLKSLQAYNSNISDLTPLAGLVNLEALYLAYNPITSIAPLAGMTSLRNLNLDQTQVTDLSALASLASLSTLELRNLNLTDIGALASLDSLQSLHLVGNAGLSDLSPLSGLNSLTVLYLDSTGVTSTAALAGLSSLTTLSLNSLGLSDLSGLSGLTGLRNLFLESNGISDISQLAGLTGLYYLYLNNNDISDISALASLSSLFRLHLNQNRIVDISPLSTLSSLLYLYAHNNLIEDVSPLAEVTGLIQVYLSGNAVTTGVASLVTLTSANVIDLRLQSDIPCGDLAALEAALGAAVVYAPDECAP